MHGWSDGADDDQVADALAAERATLSSAVRADAARLRAFLAPDFTEFGSSGTEFGAEVADRVAETAADGPAITVERLRGRRLADGVVLVTYRSEASGRRALRSSIWLRTGSGWRMVHHQGTPTS